MPHTDEKLKNALWKMCYFGGLYWKLPKNTYSGISSSSTTQNDQTLHADINIRQEFIAHAKQLHACVVAAKAQTDDIQAVYSAINEEQFNIQRYDATQVHFRRYAFFYHRGTLVLPFQKCRFKDLEDTIEFEGQQKLQEKIQCTPEAIIDFYVPKTMLLIHLDAMLKALEEKNTKLQAKAEKNPTDYTEVAAAAMSTIEKLCIARETFLQLGLPGKDGSVERNAASLAEGFQQLQTDSTSAFNGSKAIFERHRGIHKEDNKLINGFLDVCRTLVGYIALVVTSPGRLYDNEKVNKYVNSYFKRPDTDTLHQFSTFNKGLEDAEIKRLFGIDTKPSKKPSGSGLES